MTCRPLPECITDFTPNVPESPGRGRAAAPARVRLEEEDCNSPDTINTERFGPGDLLIMQARSGGALHPTDGKGRRLAYLRQFEALAKNIQRPILLTLTVDRENWKGPREAFLNGSALIAKLLSERLGFTVWGRVLEIQSKSGDGWPHWHILADLTGTPWHTSTGWVDLKGLCHRIRQVWQDEWGMGNPDVQWRARKYRKPEYAARYMAKYLVKGLHAIPVWMLESESAFRLVGFSKVAGRLVRRTMGLPERSRRLGEGRPRRTPRPLVERLAASGLYCKVLQRTATGGYKHLGTMKGCFACASTTAHAFRLAGAVGHITIERPPSGKGPLVVVVRGVPSAAGYVAGLRRESEALGFSKWADAEFRRRKRDWMESWDRMQSEQDGG